MDVMALPLPLTSASRIVANSTVARTVAQEVTLARGSEHHTSTHRTSGSDANALDIGARATATRAAAAHASAFRGGMPNLLLRKLSSVTVWPTGHTLSMSANIVARHPIGSQIISFVAPLAAAAGTWRTVQRSRGRGDSGGIRVPMALAASPFRSEDHAWMPTRAVGPAEDIARQTLPLSIAIGPEPATGVTVAAASHLISRSAGSLSDRVRAVDVSRQTVPVPAWNLMRAMPVTPAISPELPWSRNSGGDLDLVLPARAHGSHDPVGQPVIRRFAMADDVPRGGEPVRATMTSVSELARQAASAPRPETAAPVAVSPGATTSIESAKGAGADIEDLVERVSRRLFRQLAIERERRGPGSWLQ
jgi:hypothetical protein